MNKFCSDCGRGRIFLTLQNDMIMESYEAIVKRLQMYHDLFEAEKDIEIGRTKDARMSWEELKEKSMIF